MCFLICFTQAAFAQEELSGQWYSVANNWTVEDSPHTPIEAPLLTGGNFVHTATFNILTPQTYVIDFKNASVIGSFHHYIFDQNQTLISHLEGGIESDIKNTFFMRHGRKIDLSPGQYTLITQLQSPYFIAQPQPYIDIIDHYEQAIKWGTVISLVCLGILISLGVYYIILAMVRKRTAEIMYTCFIWLNVVFTGTSMLITPDLLNIHWFYLAGLPILFSNFAYLLFAKSLLQIHQSTHPKLHFLALFVLGLLTLLLITALTNKHWILECARIGVGLMMLFSLLAAIVRAIEGYRIAYYYLIAIMAFFVIGSIAISSNDLEGIFTIYVEHIGLIAVTTEVLLIGLVLGYQFAEIYREKEQHLALAEHSLRIAHHDALTGLPNRYALDLKLTELSQLGILIIVDIDNLKLYNDNFGHQKGDEMLRMFADLLSSELDNLGILHRMGGDEFAITSEHSFHSDKIEEAIIQTIELMIKNGFDQAGASFGSARLLEANSIQELIELADKRMYRHKRSKST